MTLAYPRWLLAGREDFLSRISTGGLRCVNAMSPAEPRDARRVRIDGTLYASIRAAADEHRVTELTIRNWLSRGLAEYEEAVA